MNELISLAAPLAGGGLAGFCSGFALKKIGGLIIKIACAIIGAFFVGMMFMQYKGYVSGIDWQRIGADMAGTVNQAVGSVDGGSVMGIFDKIGIPVTSGFVAGFVVGLRR